MSLFDATSMHCYWSTAGLTRWNALRWRLFPRPSGLLLVTECGRDKVRDGPNGTYLPSETGENFGWRAQGIDGDQFLRELAAYDQELRADGVYGVVFTTSSDDEWRRKGFSMDDLADRCHGFTNLGPHDLEGRSPQALAWAAVAPIVKSVDQTAAIRRAPVSAITIYRRRFTPAEQDDMLERGDDDRLVGAILEGLAGFRHPRLHAELLNEVGKGRRDQYVALARKAVPRLRRNGLLVAGPSWATGDYEADDWVAFTSAAPAPPAPAPTPAPAPKPTPGGVTVPDVVLSVLERHSHAVDGNWGNGERFGPCVGVVIHSTASGVDQVLENEYVGTINWFQNPDARVSAQRLIGAGRFAEVNTSVHDGEVAYHARDPANERRRGIEFAHPDTPAWNARPYPDEQYEMAGELIARWKIVDEAAGHRWPIKLLTRADLAADPNAPGICYHRDLPAGIKDGRRDPTGPFDGAKLIAATTRWYAKLSGGAPTPAPKPPVVDPIPPSPGHWPNGRVIASGAEYELHVWGPIYVGVQALLNGGDGALGDDQDARDLLVILGRNKARHGIKSARPSRKART